MSSSLADTACTHLMHVELAKFWAPVLLFQGEFAPLAKNGCACTVVQAIGHVYPAVVVIPGGDHAAFLETPRPQLQHVLVDSLHDGKKKCPDQNQSLISA